MAGRTHDHRTPEAGRDPEGPAPVRRRALHPFEHGAQQQQDRDDIATEAVDSRGAGVPLEARVRGRLEAHLGADLAGVRVHADARARAATAGIDARAFTYGKDIFLGPGETPGDLALMAHEVTHVVQQGASGRLLTQRQVQVGEAHAPAEVEADAVAAAVLAAPETWISDGPPAAAGQMQREEFLGQLRQDVIAAAADALGTFWSAAGCPYIERWFREHAQDDAASLEKLARRYSGVSAPRSARDYIPPICSRLRAAIGRWREGEDVAADLAASGLVPSEAAGSIPSAATVGKPGADSVDTVRALGRGAALDGQTAARMSDAFGASFGSVRIHTGEHAARKTRELDASAFTVGQHIAFAAGEYRPGTPMGDALIAHELAHVLQQGSADPAGRRQPVSGESAAHEADAQAATEGAVARLWQGGKRTLQDAAPRVRPALTSGFQLQRCSKAEKTRLESAATRGAWEGRKVAVQPTFTVRLSDTEGELPIVATRTLGTFDTEEAALAAAKTNGTAGAVTIESGKYVAYECDIGFSYKVVFTPTGEGWGDTTYQLAKAVPGVVALVSDEGLTMRPEKFDPLAAGPQDTSGKRALKSADDPFQGYKDALAGGKGLDSLDDPTLLLAFPAAMKDTALLILARSEVEVTEKQQTLMGGKASVGPEEMKAIQTTAKKLADLDREIGEQEMIAKAYEPDVSMPSSIDDPSTSMRRIQLPSEIETWMETREKIAGLNQQRMVALAAYPMLARVDPSDFVKLTDEQMIAALGAQTPGILKDIQETREKILDDDLELWAISQIVDATIAGLGIKAEAKRKVIKDKAAAKARSKTISQIIRTVFMVGFGLAAAFVTGPLGLAFAAGAFGLSLYDAIEQTNQYLAKKPASNTNLDPSASIIPPAEVAGWGWLVVAWVGVGLDAAMVVKAVSAVAKAERSVAAAAEELSKTAKIAGIPEEELLARLKMAAGELDPALKLSEAGRAAIARRLGTTIEVDARLGSEVRVVYTVEEATGQVRVVGMRCGDLASVADVLGHEGVLTLMRRYEGLTGRIRQLSDRLLSMAGRSPAGMNPFKPGSAAWESWLELKKLPSLIKARNARLGAGFVRASEEAGVRGEVKLLENELARHQAIVDEMALEAGQGFVAKTGETSMAAAKRGFPLPDIEKPAAGLTAQDVAKSEYYYRLNEKGDGYVLVKKAESARPSLRAETNPDGSFKAFVEGDLTRAERAQKILEGFSKQEREAFETLKSAEEAKGSTVVPIRGMATTEKTIGGLTRSTPDFRQRLFEIILDALTRKGEKNAVKVANEAVDAVMKHPVTVVQGTDQLRAFGYRGNFLKVTGKTAAELDDLHHLVPLYLGGDSRIKNLLDISEDLHRRLHDLIDAVPYAEGVTLAPGSIQRASDLTFNKAAAILKPDGAIELRPLAAGPVAK